MYNAPTSTATAGRTRHRSSAHGFTLIELTVVVVIMAVLAGLAAPSFRDYTDKMRVAKAADELMASLHLLRAEAISRNGMVRMSKLTGANCPGMLSVQFWHCGWRIFADVNNNQALDAGEELIREFRLELGEGVNIAYSVNAAGFTANRWGQVNGINALSFTLSPTSGSGGLDSTKTVCMNSGGRIRIVERSVVCP